MSERIITSREFVKGAIVGAAAGAGIAKVVEHKDYLHDRLPIGQPIDPYRFYRPGIIEPIPVLRASAEKVFAPFFKELVEEDEENLLWGINFLDSDEGKDYGLILLPNHSSHADSWTIDASLRKHGTSNAIYLAGPHVTRNPLYRVFPTILVASPTLMPKDYDERVQMKEVNEMAKQAEEEATRQRRILVGYLEGTRNNGKVGPIGGGAMDLLDINHDENGRVRLIAIPVGLPDTYINMPKGNWQPRRAQYTVRYGKPIFFETIQNLRRKQQAEFVRNRIVELLPEEMR